MRTARKFLGLVRRCFGFDQTETVAVVCAYRLWSRSEKRGERHAGGDRQRIPAGDVDPRKRHGDHSAHSDQSKMARQRSADIKGCDPRIGDDLERRLEDARHCGGNRRKIAEQVGATGNPLRGVKVDEQQWRMANRLRARAERPCHRNGDWRAAKRADVQNWDHLGLALARRVQDQNVVDDAIYGGRHAGGAA